MRETDIRKNFRWSGIEPARAAAKPKPRESSIMREVNPLRRVHATRWKSVMGRADAYTCGMTARYVFKVQR
ncbi:hypothetical protein HYPSUDRAFT_38624 [Hypholoma sublateritium FD-334 SS-4]|uniref:Uncharacterized protein n=1 Tax=Hypholoma sublateritium (strain FD-334 SS-4) TaxID=945553 RepID=A0A0D2PYX3_HYPSF|nr:hypothetical protein HYPSUDRAFT_38624 [Hypholoma sublateritium FD-334 SS-4]